MVMETVNAEDVVGVPKSEHVAEHKSEDVLALSTACECLKPSGDSASSDTHTANCQRTSTAQATGENCSRPMALVCISMTDHVEQHLRIPGHRSQHEQHCRAIKPALPASPAEELVDGANLLLQAAATLDGTRPSNATCSPTPTTSADASCQPSSNQPSMPDVHQQRSQSSNTLPAKRTLDVDQTESAQPAKRLALDCSTAAAMPSSPQQHTHSQHAHPCTSPPVTAQDLDTVMPDAPQPTTHNATSIPSPATAQVHDLASKPTEEVGAGSSGIAPAVASMVASRPGGGASCNPEPQLNTTGHPHFPVPTDEPSVPSSSHPEPAHHTYLSSPHMEAALHLSDVAPVAVAVAEAETSSPSQEPDSALVHPVSSPTSQVLLGATTSPACSAAPSTDHTTPATSKADINSPQDKPTSPSICVKEDPDSTATPAQDLPSHFGLHYDPCSQHPGKPDSPAHSLHQSDTAHAQPNHTPARHDSTDLLVHSSSSLPAAAESPSTQQPSEPASDPMQHDSPPLQPAPAPPSVPAVAAAADPAHHQGDVVMAPASPPAPANPNPNPAPAAPALPPLGGAAASQPSSPLPFLASRGHSLDSASVLSTTTAATAPPTAVSSAPSDASAQLPFLGQPFPTLQSNPTTPSGPSLPHLPPPLPQPAALGSLQLPTLPTNPLPADNPYSFFNPAPSNPGNFLSLLMSMPIPAAPLAAGTIPPFQPPLNSFSQPSITVPPPFSLAQLGMPATNQSLFPLAPPANTASFSVPPFPQMDAAPASISHPAIQPNTQHHMPHSHGTTTTLPPLPSNQPSSSTQQHPTSFFPSTVHFCHTSQAPASQQPLQPPPPLPSKPTHTQPPSSAKGKSSNSNAKALFNTQTALKPSPAATSSSRPNKPRNHIDAACQTILRKAGAHVCHITNASAQLMITHPSNKGYHNVALKLISMCAKCQRLLRSSKLTAGQLRRVVCSIHIIQSVLDAMNKLSKQAASNLAAGPSSGLQLASGSSQKPLHDSAITQGWVLDSLHQVLDVTQQMVDSNPAFTACLANALMLQVLHTTLRDLVAAICSAKGRCQLLESLLQCLQLLLKKQKEGENHGQGSAGGSTGIMNMLKLMRALLAQKL